MKHSSRIAAVTILALITLAICCQMLPIAHANDAMQTIPESAEHMALLVTNLPSSVLALALLMIATLLLVAIPLVGQHSTYTPSFCTHPPDILFATPLRLAFADGILNPKLH